MGREGWLNMKDERIKRKEEREERKDYRAKRLRGKDSPS